jgi:hypothetical protein
MLTWDFYARTFYTNLSDLGFSVGKVPNLIRVVGKIYEIPYYYDGEDLKTNSFIYKPNENMELAIPACSGTTIIVANI